MVSSIFFLSLVGIFATTLAFVGLVRGKLVSIHYVLRNKHKVDFWRGFCYQLTIGLACLYGAVRMLVKYMA